MTHRTAVRQVVWWLIGTAACSGDHATGPAVPTCSSAFASQVALPVGGYTSLDPGSDGGCATFPASPSTVDSAEYLLVPQSAAGTFGVSSPFVLRAATLAATTTPAAQLLPSPAGPRAAATQFDGFLRRRGGAYPLGATLPSRSAPVAPAAALAGPPGVGSLRTFVVCAKLDCSQFKNVGARARAVGAHVAVYVDTLAPANGLDSADIDTLKQVFDARLYPLDSTAFGAVSDVDANGVVIALMTPVVNSLVTKAACDSSGFIAGFFFPDDLIPGAPSSQSNHGEIFYSIVADPTGALSCTHTSAGVKSITPGTFVHEFQHMINFAQHILIRGGVATEEGWLDEGLSKYAEELAGRSYLQQGDTVTFSQYAFNDVDDAYTYLSATGGSPLLIEFDQGTLAEVGASWLFTRYLVDQFGDSLPRKLDQTILVGSANVAAQTGQSFTTTITRWALANWVSDDSVPGFIVPPELKYTSWHFRRTFASLNRQDPADFPRPFPLVPTTSAGGAVSLSGTLTAGSGVYARALQAPGGPAFTVSFSRDGSAALPAAIVPRLSVIRIR